jgi:DNA-binding XRE family transcriptional regulator
MISMDYLQLRKSKKWSQVKAAKAVGVSLFTWQRWEYGANKPSIENIKKIKEVFDLKEGEEK